MSSLEKLKEAKELLSMELITQDDFDKIKAEALSVLKGAAPESSLVTPNSTSEERTFVLQSVPRKKKLKVIKIIRRLISGGLKDAKDFVEQLPSTIKVHSDLDSNTYQESLQTLKKWGCLSSDKENAEKRKRAIEREKEEKKAEDKKRVAEKENLRKTLDLKKEQFDRLPQQVEVKQEYRRKRKETRTRTVKTGWFSSKEETYEVDVFDTVFAIIPLQKISAGSFMMGALPDDNKADKNESPRHKVTLTNNIYVGMYPCTQELYEAVMECNPSSVEMKFTEEPKEIRKMYDALLAPNPSSIKDARRPVEQVSWCDAVFFCNKLSKLEGLEPCYIIPKELESWVKEKPVQRFSYHARIHHAEAGAHELSKEVKWNRRANGYRLPTEAEWEYCAKAGEEYLYSGSNNIDAVAWHAGKGEHETHSVGEKKVNDFGLYDMTGNVSEWCWDTWDPEAYQREESIDPVVENSSTKCEGSIGFERIYRDRNYSYFQGIDQIGCRMSKRAAAEASTLRHSQGFRFVRTVVAEKQ